MTFDQTAGLIAHVIFLSVVYIATVRWRLSLAGLFQRLPFPTIIQYLICALPFIIIEEAVNCIECFPLTIIWLSVYMLILGVIVQKIRATNIVQILLIFSVIGTVWEVAAGGAKDIPALPLPLAVFMLIWTAISYSFLAIVPLTILVKK